MQNFNAAASHKRKQRDITKLMMSNYKVTPSAENPYNFRIEIEGPSDSLYAGGTWSLNVHLPEQYPYKSPSIGFANKIFHPNVDEASGSVCLDVINQAWSPMFDLINVFDVFIPQLLQYPNPSDPLNPEAAALLLKEKAKYEKRVKDMVKKYALKFKEPVTTTNEKSINSGQNNDSTKQIDEMEEESDVSQISVSDLSELSVHSEHNDIMTQF